MFAIGFDLRVDDGGQQLIRDPDLRAHPEVLDKAGVLLQAAEARQADDRRKLAAERGAAGNRFFQTKPRIWREARRGSTVWMSPWPQ